MDENFYDDLNMEFHGLFDLLKNPFVESFFIKGEPDYHLGISLKRCPESLQDVIAEEYDMNLGRGKGRKRQLEVLGQKIIEEMPDRLEGMSEDEFKLLMTLFFGEEDIEEAAGGLGLQKMGWIFYYIDHEEQNTIPAVPVEIMEKLKTLIADRGFIRRMTWNRVFRSCINTFTRLYGVFNKNWLFALIEKYCASDDNAEFISTGALEDGSEDGFEEVSEDVSEDGSKDVSEDVSEDGSEDASAEDKAGMAEWPEPEILIGMLRKVLDRMQKESGDTGLDGDYIFDSDLEENEEYLKRYDAVKDKPYYEPTAEDIALYRENYIDERTKEYRVLKRYLSKIYDDEMTAGRLLEELSIEAVEELGGIFAIPEILERYDFTCSSVEDLKEFEQLFRNWEDQVRKWNNRGFTNAELKARGENGSSVKIDWDLANMKFKADTPDPDAPCPCGSGKKYRQCCGRTKR